MTKWVKRVLGGLSLVILVALVWGGKQVLDLLPSQEKIAASVRGAKSPQQNRSLLTESAANAGAKTVAPTDEAVQKRATEASRTDSATDRKESAADLLSIADEDPRDIRVCENLGRSRFKSDDALGTHLQFDALFQGERNDSVIEAVRFPVRAIFQDESVVSLLRELDGLEKEGVTQKSPEEKSSTLEKIGFYGRVMKAGSQLYLNRAHYESIGDRAVHLRTIAQLAMRSPELARDAQLQDFCREIERAGSSDVSPTAIAAERARLVSFIQSRGLKPEEIGFDPNEHVKFSVQASQTGFSFSLSDKTLAE